MVQKYSNIFSVRILENIKKSNVDVSWTDYKNTCQSI